jgi:hypothetical protein
MILRGITATPGSPFSFDLLFGDARMQFEDDDVKIIDPTTQGGLAKLLEHLCGEPVSLGCNRPGAPCNDCQACMNWVVLESRLKSPTLSLEDLNDILLLVNQFPLGSAFFEFFFSNGEKAVTFEELKQGIVTFKGFALLRYGNVRFAYRSLFKLRKEELAGQLGRWHTDTAILRKQYGSRRNAPALPKEISADLTWMLGYIAKGGADRDLATYAGMSYLLNPTEGNEILAKLSFNDEQKLLYDQRRPFLESALGWKQQFKDLAGIEEEIKRLGTSISQIRHDGWLNTSHYLASDCMDVYVATSMREKWEFQDVHNVVRKAFADPKLAKLKLRYFDPTQSFLDNRVDKGLVEALMLKRSECTVYLVQETDTFGKDSELATTLAQGKPVIAYVPRIDVERTTKTAESRPLSFFQKRLSQLAAEDKIPPKNSSEVYRFLEKLTQFQPFFRIVNEEQQFLEKNKLFETKRAMSGILAEAERKLFDSRAETLQKRHPLALQVELQSGVANGVLVVRSEEECADLLSRLLTNRCTFRFDSKREIGVTALIERISDSPFRVVTHNGTLTNAFWSLYG